MPTIGRNILATVLLIVVGCYMGITLLYVMPEDCPIRKDHAESLRAVDMFFFQRWGFFAPPPDKSDRTYFFYTSSKDPKSYKMLEIARPITKSKSLNIFHNENARILDYIIAGLREQTLRTVAAMKDYTEGLPNLDRITIDSRVDMQNIISWKQYARIVAEENSLSTNFDVCSIEMTSYSRPDFDHRELILKPYNGESVLLCQISPFYLYKSEPYPYTASK